MYIYIFFYFVFILLSTARGGIGTHEEGNFLQPQHHIRFVRNSVDILLSKTRLYSNTVCDNGTVQRSASFIPFRTIILILHCR